MEDDEDEESMLVWDVEMLLSDFVPTLSAVSPFPSSAAVESMFCRPLSPLLSSVTCEVFDEDEKGNEVGREEEEEKEEVTFEGGSWTDWIPKVGDTVNF